MIMVQKAVPPTWDGHGCLDYVDGRVLTFTHRSITGS